MTLAYLLGCILLSTLHQTFLACGKTYFSVFFNDEAKAWTKMCFGNFSETKHKAENHLLRELSSHFSRFFEQFQVARDL